MSEQKVSFYDYCIATHEGEDSPLGDFVYDMKRDKEFPKSVAGRVHHVHRVGIVPYKENEYQKCVMDHLVFMHACEEAKSAFRKLWKEYNETMKEGGDGLLPQNALDRIRNRVNEIIRDYAYDKDETYMYITLYFEKDNGESQQKRLVIGKPSEITPDECRDDPHGYWDDLDKTNGILPMSDVLQRKTVWMLNGEVWDGTPHSEIVRRREKEHEKAMKGLAQELGLTYEGRPD